jgi:hypothetical protein
MRLVHVAKRQADGLIDSRWVEGFEAYQVNDSGETCPYLENTDEFRSWQEGWLYAADHTATGTSVPCRPSSFARHMLVGEPGVSP